MGSYILRRLLLLPLTLFCILLVNFAIINLAPGDPTSITEVSQGGEATRSDKSPGKISGDMRYLQFRERYGLTLPILFNTWVFITDSYVEKTLDTLDANQLMSLKDLDALKVLFGDQARFIMPKLLHVIESSQGKRQALAMQYFIRGGTKQAIVRPYLTDEEKSYNKDVAESNRMLRLLKTPLEFNQWYKAHALMYNFEPNVFEKIKMFFFETRLCRYLTRVMTLDFGTMRNDPNKLVIDEVVKRFKYSLTLSIIPMILTLIFCQVFGFLMAYHQGGTLDLSLNLLFLFLYAIPVFVVAPFLIEKVALNNTFPWTDIPIPISGFTSKESIYQNMSSNQRLLDTLQHLVLPFIAIMYGGLAAETRLSRTAVLEVLRQDYVRTAYAKGLSPFQVMTKHVAPNAGITIVTAVAGSLGAVLGGSLIVETLFDINGFGKFFYDAVINRDYNVVMFSALAGAFLTLIGYLVADLCYMFLDPRVSLE